jgi:hypothetical protein
MHTEGNGMSAKRYFAWCFATVAIAIAAVAVSQWMGAPKIVISLINAGMGFSIGWAARGLLKAEGG